MPPPKYGGTELVVYNLVEELVRLGHDVTLLASGDSQTSAKLVPCVPASVRTLPEASHYSIRTALNYSGLARALRTIQGKRFDILHNHIGWPVLIFSDFVRCPMVTTMHGTLAERSEHYIYNKFGSERFISISMAQRRPLPHINYIANVYNGIDVSRFRFTSQPKDYVAFLGRIHPDKGPKQAIAIARRLGLKLIIAAKVDPTDEAYFKREIEPEIDGRQVVFLGEVGHSAKVELLRHARALLSPIQWDEPFGLVNTEAMACGTPVMTMARGSIPEIVVDKKVGVVANSEQELVQRWPEVAAINRWECRRHVEANFSLSTMTEGYLAAYRRTIEEHNQARLNRSRLHLDLRQTGYGNLRTQGNLP